MNTLTLLDAINAAMASSRWRCPSIFEGRSPTS